MTPMASSAVGHQKIIQFKEGYLEIHQGSENRLFFGEGPKLGTVPFLLFTPLVDLSKLETSPFPFLPNKINETTIARHTLTGGLVLSRTKDSKVISGYKNTSVFSRKEFKKIKEFMYD